MTRLAALLIGAAGLALVVFGVWAIDHDHRTSSDALARAERRITLLEAERASTRAALDQANADRAVLSTERDALVAQLGALGARPAVTARSVPVIVPAPVAVTPPPSPVASTTSTTAPRECVLLGLLCR